MIVIKENWSVIKLYVAILFKNSIIHDTIINVANWTKQQRSIGEVITLIDIN